MKHEEFQEVGPEIIAENRYPEKEDGRFGPSQVSGCPLKVFLDMMADVEFITSSWTFAGTAVHYYLQESGILTEALVEAGYHPAFIDYEVTTEYEIQDGVYIHGSCDVLADDGDDKVVYDIKFSSIPADSGHGRVYKYFSQANTYAHMFGADGYGLILINSKSKVLEDNIEVMEGEMSEDNWEIVQDKVVNVHNALQKAGYYDGNRFSPEQLTEAGKDFWREIVKDFELSRVPSYDKECQYCEHKEYCPDYNGTLGGLKALLE